MCATLSHEKCKQYFMHCLLMLSAEHDHVNTSADCEESWCVVWETAGPRCSSAARQRTMASSRAVAMAGSSHMRLPARVEANEATCSHTTLHSSAPSACLNAGPGTSSTVCCHSDSTSSSVEGCCKLFFARSGPERRAAREWWCCETGSTHAANLRQPHLSR